MSSPEPASARHAAVQMLSLALGGPAPPRGDPGFGAGLEPRDLAFARHLSTGVLRWFGALEWLAERLLERPLRKRDSDIRHLLLIGIFQLWRDSSPPHAAVHAAAETARAMGKPWAVSLVNAVLRRFQREAPALLAELEQSAHRHAHPAWLLDALARDWPDHWRAIVEAGNSQPPLWLRVNRRRTNLRDYRDMLESAGFQGRGSPVAPDAVEVRPAVGVDDLPGFGAGLVSVQDAGAQLAAEVLQPAAGSRVLDACAAPGGKTCHLLEKYPDIQLTAVDRSAARTGLIRENLGRLGLDCSLITADVTATSQWWDGERFDSILLDSPCSATGVVRRHPEIKWLRDPGQVQVALERQRSLLEALWLMVKPGGILVYATCSVLKSENVGQIHEFLARHTDARCIGPVPKGIPGHPQDGAPGCQILPGESGMDGFYYAVLRKSG